MQLTSNGLSMGFSAMNAEGLDVLLKTLNKIMKTLNRIMKTSNRIKK